MKEYLKLKKLLEEKKRKLLEDQKKSSRQQILNKMKQNRRMSVVEPEDNPDQKIEALQHQATFKRLFDFSSEDEESAVCEFTEV